MGYADNRHKRYRAPLETLDLEVKPMRRDLKGSTRIVIEDQNCHQHCTLDEFITDNREMGYDWLSEILNDLRYNGKAYVGGGASPHFTVRVDE